MPIHRDLAIHKKYLRQDKTERKGNENDLANEFLGLAHQKAQYGNKGEEDSHQCSHNIKIQPGPAICNRKTSRYFPGE